MKHQMNLNDLNAWRDRGQDVRFTQPNVDRWNRSRGRVTTTVRGSHVDITVRLYRCASYLWPVLIVVAFFLTAITLYRIAAPIVSGRVEQIITGAR